MSRRGQLLAAVVAVAVLLFGVLIVAALRSTTVGCAYPPPQPDLSPELRSLGAFEQPFSSDAATLDSAATEAVTGQYPDLDSAVAQPPLAIASPSRTTPPAVVVTLTGPAASTAGSRVIGAVAFLQDCAGREYFDQMADWTKTPLTAFPTVTQSAAKLRLHAQHVVLSYISSPLHPVWRDPTNGHTTPAT